MKSGIDIKEQNTTYSMSIPTLERINDVLIFCNQCALSFNYVGWFNSLQVLYREVSAKMKSEEIKKYNELRVRVLIYTKPMSQKKRHDMEQTLGNIPELDEYLRRILWDKGLMMWHKENSIPMLD